MAQKQYFLGARRNAGEMDGDKKGEKITWDNIVISRCQQIDSEKNPGSVGMEILNNAKIKFSDFEEITGMTYEEFMKTANDRIMDPIIVFFGELKGSKDDRKADVVMFRFVNEDGTIDF